MSEQMTTTGGASNVPLTRAGQTYLTNADRFVALIEVVSRGTGEKTRTLAALANQPGAIDTTRVTPPLSGQIADASVFVNLWYVVMLVTFVEAFLHDVLTECAEIDPRLMAQSEQQVNYSEVQRLGSMEAVVQELRSRWARNFIDDGGPARWIDRLARMGVSGFPKDLGVRLEEAWGVRHIVVHRAGVANSEFAERHPIVGVLAGQQVTLPLYVVFEYADAIGQFVRIVDRGIGGRIKSVSGPGTRAFHPRENA